MKNKKLRYALVNHGNLLLICQYIIRKYGLAKAMSNMPVSNFEGVEIKLKDPLGIASYFNKEAKITLSTIEALSMVYLVLYYEHKAEPNTEYLVGVDIEKIRQNQTDRELYLSDGLLAKHRKGKLPSITPFQQVLAQNIVGKNRNHNIEDEIIKQIKAKTQRRGTYNKVSGLLISILPIGGEINIERICSECDMESFVPTFLILYMNDLDRCTIFHLDSSIKSVGDLKKRSLEIKPSLKIPRRVS